ncbi:MAG: deoxyribodipyrimidine photolyase [Gammaproteobacteria bacterium]|nr:MAG: deoxyribodipyrimidine photolyase [Gammaproteobacteria bacterium]
MSEKNKLVWFRNDLRAGDNAALYRACEGGGQVIAVALISPAQWVLQDESKSRVQFWLANLAKLKEQLAALNIPLKVLTVADNSAVPSALAELAASLDISELYFNREYPEYEQRRDEQLEQLLARRGVVCTSFDSDVVFAPGTILNKQQQPYKVFTPFAKAWRYQFTLTMPAPLPLPKKQMASTIKSDAIPKAIAYPIKTGADYDSERWPPGSEAAHGQLQQFVHERVFDYGGDRDVPAVPGTSALSPYLSVGALSVRQCVAALQNAMPGDAWLASQWLTELIWREFYRHLLVAFPQMNRWQPFREEVERRIVWQPDQRLFKAWCEGETGFAIVDAGMKQLLETGWMHNRLRMVTASFLSKLLRQDWRQGARFFMRHLIDGDFASNLGGWQWCASVGADAAPYFRIFNPARQAQRFDPHGLYVAKWLPELADLGISAHQNDLFTTATGRPPPIINYSEARARSLESYKNQS